ncbi:MAG: L-serine ammonia-lyase, iron-sulfur-dependent, subunit alpha [Duncaniella sp.]|nr:L-serine ammonia-lyase, iron-sulfur-dependent, subunit alpha [Duncaniella sp.]MDE7145934.1 L-serine ammonia-lyase, iron-sulfur-dependent, subunit alpha [Duncaniella sp.]
MIKEDRRGKIISLIKREVVPAIGCTEPVAVALCVAKATELLGSEPERIEARLSSNILKNAMGVGIPGTGMIGLPIAMALGALIGKPEYSLEVLRDVCPEAVERGKKYISEGRIKIDLDADAPSKLHIDVTVTAGDDTARAVISCEHTHFVRLEKNGEVLHSEEAVGDSVEAIDDVALDMATIFEFATETPVEELAFIMEAKELNKAASETALKGDYGHSLGATIRRYGMKYYGDTPVEHMISYTSAACDARMGGAPIAVMSNSGSGNQGITATMPVVSFAEDMNATEEQTIRALILSHLTSIYIKQSLGRLSALCGCVVASTGASGAIVYLMGGGFDEVCAAIKNMIANLTGMICDGAKPSCALKISSGVTTAMMSAMLAMNGKCVTSAEGIVSEDVDATIHNLTSIGREAMTETDRLVLKIMTTK